jgi:hypothetical protein
MIYLKNIVWFILLFIVINNANAQAAVSNDHENTLFIGIDNPLEIAIQNEPLSSIEIDAMGAGITVTGENGRYIARVISPGGAVISLFCTKNGNRELVGKYSFHPKRLSPPIVTLNGRDSRGNIGNGEFKAMDGLRIESYDFDAEASIISYDFTRIAPDKTVQTTHVTGALYNAEALRLRNLATPNTVYFFENIKTKIKGFYNEIKADDMRFLIK